MKLSRDEELFLRHWIYDEAHYQDGVGPAKRLQVQHHTTPADLATIIAAAMPDLEEQALAANGPPPSEPPVWPWSGETFRSRFLEARTVLAGQGTSGPHRQLHA
jgi:hypothetical protein